MPDGPVTPVIEKVGLHDAFHGGARLGRADVVMCRKGRPVVDAKAYSEARERERDVVLPDGTHVGRTPEHWRRVALIAARMTGKRVSFEPATRMLERGDE